MKKSKIVGRTLMAIGIVLSMYFILCYYTVVRMAVTVLFLMPALYVAWRYRIDEDAVSRNIWLRVAFVLLAAAMVTFPFYKELDVIVDRFSLESSDVGWLYFCYYLLSLPFLSLVFAQMTVSGDNPALVSYARVLDSRTFWWLCLLLGVVAVASQFFCAFSDTVWYDEVFTLCLISHDYAEMTQLAAGDVHPMLYYYIVKAIVWILTTIDNGIGVIVASKLASVLPFVLLLLLMSTIVRRRMGRWVSAVAILGTFALSNMIWQGVEIRMYGWAALWVTAACVSLYCTLCRPTVLNMLCFVLAGTCAACTHHFAALAYGGLLVAWGLWVLFVSDNRRDDIMRYAVCVIAFALLYLPQMRVSFGQFSDVTGGEYWIEPIDGLTLLSYLYNMFGNSLMGASVIAVGAVGVTIFGPQMRDAKQRPGIYMAIVSFALPLWVMFCGLTVSLALRPVFVPRYLYPTMPCMAMGIGMIASYAQSTRLRLWYTCILMSTFLLIVVAFVKSERLLHVDLIKSRDIYDNYPGATFVADDVWTLWDLGVDVDHRECFVLHCDLTDDEKSIFNVHEEYVLEDADQLMHLADERPDGLLFIKNDDPDSLLDHSRYRAVEVGRNMTNTVIYKLQSVSHD